MKTNKSTKTRDDLFVQVLGNRIATTFASVVEGLLEAAYEARDYYDRSSMTKRSNKNIMYWQGYIDCLHSIESSCSSNYREMIRSYGGEEKMLYLAHYMAQGLRHYEDFKNGNADPLKITTESFSLFHRGGSAPEDNADQYGEGQ